MTYSAAGRRALTVLGACATALALAAGPALAAGTAGVELTPTGTGSAFRVQLGYGKHATKQFTLHNLRAQPATVTLYGAAAYRSPSGTFSVGEAGSAPWIALPTQTVHMAPKQQRTFDFGVTRDHTTTGRTAYGAIVIEVVHGSIRERAATLVYLQRPGSDPVKHIVLPALLAVAVLLIVAAAHTRVRMRRRALQGAGTS